MSDDRTITDVDLSPEEAAVVGVMRRSERAEKALFNYAINFGAEPTPDPSDL